MQDSQIAFGQQEKANDEVWAFAQTVSDGHNLSSAWFFFVKNICDYVNSFLACKVFMEMQFVVQLMLIVKSRWKPQVLSEVESLVLENLVPNTSSYLV